MEGEDEDSENPRAFNNAKIWKRMIIIVAGAFMNIIFGMVLLMITLIPNDNFESTTVSQFTPYSYTAACGLQEGDEIIEINGYDINTATDFSFALYTLPVSEVDGKSFEIYKEDCLYTMYTHAADCAVKTTQEQVDKINQLVDEGSYKIFETKDRESAYTLMCTYIDKLSDAGSKDRLNKYPEIEVKETRLRFRTDMTVIRDGEEVVLKNVDFYTYKIGEDGEPTLAIDFYVEPIDNNFFTLLSQTGKQSVSVARMVWNSLVGLVSGEFSINDVSGPVGIASAITDVASESLKSGFSEAVMSIIYVMMVISINLGIVNMLPFPALDGGRFVMLLIEAIFKKPVPRKVEAAINGVGLALLLMLMLAITMKDVWVLIFGG